jgi:nicotinate-nucleotide adenylyltransferase
LKSARYVAEQTGLDELRLIPGCQPVHRDAPVADAEQRLAMLRLTQQEFPGFVIDERELRRGGPSYTYDTLADLHRECPDAHLCLLMGLDAFKGFTGWYRWQQILQQAHLLVMIRPGYGLTPQYEVSALQQRHTLASVGELRTRRAGGILSIQVPAEDISSSAIRERLRRGQTIQGLLPTAVEDWLRHHPVYSVQQQAEPLCN